MQSKTAKRQQLQMVEYAITKLENRGVLSPDDKEIHQILVGEREIIKEEINAKNYTLNLNGILQIASLFERISEYFIDK